MTSPGWAQHSTTLGTSIPQLACLNRRYRVIKIVPQHSGRLGGPLNLERRSIRSESFILTEKTFLPRLLRSPNRRLSKRDCGRLLLATRGATISRVRFTHTSYSFRHTSKVETLA